MAEYICEITGSSGHMVLGESERVVRCRDCERALGDPLCDVWCMEHHRWAEPDGFCAWGERRGGE